MSEPFQPHPRFAVPVLEEEIARLRQQLAGAQDQIMYLTAILHHQAADHAATIASYQAAHAEAQSEEKPVEQENGGGAD